ncbi:DUF4041 domain-containing protein [Aliivibrio fischeri]|uniref:DUF4041 domain-containing protein n=1 Tax=Aliivibrio fischeri TaxID=668 RepID=UPI00354E27CF
MSFENIIVILSLVIVATLVLLIKYIKQIKQYKDKYSNIIDVDAEIESRKKSLQIEEDKSIKTQLELEQSIIDLQASYAEKRKIFDQLKAEAAIYDEDIQLAQLGFYKPHFDYDTSEKFKDEIASVKSNQKTMISNKTAITCSTEWEVSGSKAKGRTMTNRNIRMTARAFNNECDAAISNVRWNNADRMEQRINKAFDAINKLNESNTIKISYKYLELKLNELRLSHEYQEKKQQEKEEQAEIRQQMREEARLEKEFEKAQKEEDKYQTLLEKAQKDAEKATGSQLTKLHEQIQLLNDQLAEAHEKNERAKSMAEQTKMGHVYVISNTGSFGENIYKIGMTRRLEPLDRVKELGDASVPFLFDVHAMINTNDAPSLENALHNKFTQQRLNLVNNRKEFFNISLAEIKEAVIEIKPDAEFIETAEAREYRESLAIRSQRKIQENNKENALPEAI